MHRRGVLLGLGAAALCPVGGRAQSDAAPREEPWTLDGLAGTLTIPPEARDIGPVVLILAGSGPTDRDGNQPAVRTETYRMLADGLARAGVASLRYDKRGVGESAALVTREEELRFGDFVDDAMRAAEDLTAQGFGPVIAAGHSEGGALAIAASERADFAGLVLLATPGRTLHAVLVGQLESAPLPADMRAEIVAMFDIIARGGRIAEVPAQLMPVLRPSLQPYLASALGYDPAAAFADLRTPALIVWGERDIQIGRADFDALVRARPDAETLVLPAANHALKPAPADRDGNIRAYTDPALGIDPAIVPAIAAFVRDAARVRAGRPERR